MRQRIRSTTILCVRRDGKVVMAGDGQVTLGSEVLKSSAKKLRRLYKDKILAGFAGSTADAFALFARFETKLEQYNGNLSRSVVELAKEMGLLLGKGGLWGQTIRFSPPMCVNEQDADFLLEVLDRAFERL